VLSSTLGEFVTQQLLRRGVDARFAERAAAGWGGDAFQLWSSGVQHVLVVRWRWDTPADAAEFERALRAVQFTSPAAIRTRDGVTTLALASTAALASQATAGS
jgi:hypothetical protein